MTRKTTFFEGWPWFKFNNLGLALGRTLKFYTSLSKGLKLKVRKSWGLIPTFVELTGEKLVGGAFWQSPPPPTPPSWIGLRPFWKIPFTMESPVTITFFFSYSFCLLSFYFVNRISNCLLNFFIYRTCMRPIFLLQKITYDRIFFCQYFFKTGFFKSSKCNG